MKRPNGIGFQEYIRLKLLYLSICLFPWFAALGQSVSSNSVSSPIIYFIDSSEANASIKLKQWGPSLWRILHRTDLPDSAFFWKQASRLLQEAAKNGYPFASLQLDTTNSQQLTWQVVWRFSLNQAFTNGPVKIPEPNPIRKRVLAKALGIELNRPFNWLSYSEFKSRIAQLGFISLTDTPLVFFEKGQAIWQIPIQAEKSTQAEGILGFQTGERGVNITGDILIDWKNAFRHADQLRLHYRSFPGGTQQFELFSYVPYWAGTAWGSQVQVNMFRRDSTFLELQPEISLLLKTGLYTQMRFFLQKPPNFPHQARSCQV